MMTDNNDATSDRASAWKAVQETLDAANAKLVEWQERFASRGPSTAPDHVIPDTPAHRLGQEKRQRHADAVAAGEISYRDICSERQKEFTERFAAFPDSDRALLNDWALRQEARHGSPLGAVLHHAVPWPIVFLVARFGEEVAHWPTSLSADDRARLEGLDRGGKPLKYVEPLSIAAMKQHLGIRRYLFAEPEHRHHVNTAVQRAIAGGK